MKRLDFGNLCSAISEMKLRSIWYAPCAGVRGKQGKIRQEDIVNLLYSMVWHDDETIDMDYADPSAASKLYSHTTNVPPSIRHRAQCVDIALVQDNFKRRFLDWLTPQELDKFSCSLLSFAEDIPLGNGSYSTGDFVDRNGLCRLAAEVLIRCMTLPNVGSETEDEYTLLHKAPSDISLHYDPHRLSDRKANASALLIRMIDTDRDACTKEFFNLEYAVEWIVKEGMIITRAVYEHGKIKLCYSESARGKYTLRRLEKADIPRAHDLVNCHRNEFRPKMSWKTSLADMVENGLTSGKWVAYGYFAGDELVAYLDYKVRSDAEIELGVQLTSPEHRGYGLASGLVNLFRFKFLNSRLFAGTYEENSAMRRVFEKNGFRPNYFHDVKAGKRTNRIRERINPECPDDRSRLTCSVYYYANRLFDVNIIEQAED